VGKNLIREKKTVWVPIQDGWGYKANDQHKGRAGEKDPLDDFVNLVADLLCV